MVEILNQSKAKVVVSEYPTADEYWKNWRRIEKETAGRARTGAHQAKAKLKKEILFLNF